MQATMINYAAVELPAASHSAAEDSPSAADSRAPEEADAAASRDIFVLPAATAGGSSLSREAQAWPTDVTTPAGCDPVARPAAWAPDSDPAPAAVPLLAALVARSAPHPVGAGLGYGPVLSGPLEPAPAVSCVPHLADAALGCGPDLCDLPEPDPAGCFGLAGVERFEVQALPAQTPGRGDCQVRLPAVL